jgi:hypothetical protein
LVYEPKQQVHVLFFNERGCQLDEFGIAKLEHDWQQDSLMAI